MGANAQTAVPTFSANQVLLDTQMNQSARTGIPVFASTATRDAAFGGSNKTLAEGQLCYVENLSGVAQIQYYDGSAWRSLSAPGLDFIKTATVSNAASTGTAFQSIFTSDYDNYRIVCRQFASHTANVDPLMRFYYGTSTEETATYYSATNNAAVSGASAVTAVNNGSSIRLGNKSGDTGNFSTFTMDIIGAGFANETACTFQFINRYDSQVSNGAGWVDTSRTYTGVNFFMSSGNITMTAEVYGYRKA